MRRAEVHLGGKVTGLVQRASSKEVEGQGEHKKKFKDGEAASH